VTAETRAGFRLHQLELYNWGTFHERVWALEVRGDNVLVTGDIGSGKSTLVDALTTLLVPPQKAAYNKAAGADARERSARSYVLGHVRSGRSEDQSAARAVPLRDATRYSVLLGVFENEGFAEQVSLAQVFYFRDSEAQPQRLFVVANRSLSITQDFGSIGGDIAKLKKRLKTSGAEIREHYPEYGTLLRRAFGIQSEQALELFHQTVSMKSVGNLTDFVRAHMLEPFDVDSRIEALLSHFDDLNRAHESVQRAKAQVAKLAPLVAECDRHDHLTTEVEQRRACREALRGWFAHRLVDLLVERLRALEPDIATAAARVRKLDDELGELGTQRDGIMQAMAQNGGDRIAQISRSIQQHEEQQKKAADRAARYAEVVTALELPLVEDEAGFAANQARITAASERDRTAKVDLENEKTEADVALHGLKQKYHDLEHELASLRGRRSNIRTDMLKIRSDLARGADVEEAALPFAGELIQVRPEERVWEGAAERVLHGFGISMLVPDRLYGAVAAWVNANHLGGRLVYLRVLEGRHRTGRGAVHGTLAHKLSVKPDSEFRDWLQAQLAERFDHACCSTLDEFRRQRRAVTPEGQVKHGDERHEKDDRFRIDDRSRFILGWDNAAKVATLTAQADAMRKVGLEAIERLATVKKRLEELERRQGWCARLSMIDSFADIDWKSLATRVHDLHEQRKELEAASDALMQLAAQLEKVNARIETAGRKRGKSAEEHTRAVTLKEQLEKRLADNHRLVEQAGESVRDRIYPDLDASFVEAAAGRELSLDSAADLEHAVRESLTGKIDALNHKVSRSVQKIVDDMRTYCSAHPLETREIDARMESIPEFRAMLQRLVLDDLPRFELRFKELLNQNTINEVAAFQAHLKREQQIIRERIDRINASLREIPYNPGRYIRLEANPNPDAEVRDFQQDLRRCTEGGLSGTEDADYSETKFLEVKRILERLRGREGTPELDLRWRRKVTDVRNWHLFSASERWTDTDQEHEHYTDSGGKSGGQKEKLAYTVLAASLAYQFGLEFGETRSRTFRFVVIDEAFGRGSDDSARYGLELFKKLNLQLLVVTPLQKIHVIEPYVAGVGYVHKTSEEHSRIRNLTIEQYHAEAAERRA
jgi:uncharacterized protein YPO0396